MNSANGAVKTVAVTLILPDGFSGEVFVCEDRTKGQDWRKGFINIHAQGVALVNDLAGLSELAPRAFKGEYSNGVMLRNSVLKTGEGISLWPVTYVEGLALFFVVGTFREKTRVENERMRADWNRLVAAKKEG